MEILHLYWFHVKSELQKKVSHFHTVHDKGFLAFERIVKHFRQPYNKFVKNYTTFVDSSKVGLIVFGIHLSKLKYFFQNKSITHFLMKNGICLFPPEIWSKEVSTYWNGDCDLYAFLLHIDVDASWEWLLWQKVFCRMSRHWCWSYCPMSEDKKKWDGLKVLYSMKIWSTYQFTNIIQIASSHVQTYSSIEQHAS